MIFRLCRQLIIGGTVKMKKFLAILLSACMLISLAACSDNGSQPNDNPDATQPEVTEPEVTEPEVTEPEVTEPEVTEPEVTEPTEPETEPEPEPEPKPVYDASLFTEIPVTAENFGRGQISNELFESDNECIAWVEGGNGCTITGATLVSFKLPEGVAMGDSICVHIKGESLGNFRSWLIDDNEVTASEQHNMETDYGFISGEFDEIIEYTVQYVDNDITDDTATQFAFKAASWNTTLDGLTVTELGYFKGTLEEYKASVTVDGAEDAPDAENAESESAETAEDGAEGETADDSSDEESKTVEE